jgi:polyphosphate kinase
LLRERVRHEILDAYLADNVKARILQSNGNYIRAWQAHGKRKRPTGAAAFSAQDFLIGIAEGKLGVDAIPELPEPKVRRIAVGKER